MSLIKGKFSTFLLFVIIIGGLSSCVSVTKRVHRKGFYVQWGEIKPNDATLNSSKNLILNNCKEESGIDHANDDKLTREIKSKCKQDRLLKLRQVVMKSRVKRVEVVYDNVQTKTVEANNGNGDEDDEDDEDEKRLSLEKKVVMTVLLTLASVLGGYVIVVAAGFVGSNPVLPLIVLAVISLLILYVIWFFKLTKRKYEGESKFRKGMKFIVLVFLAVLVLSGLFY